MFRQLTRLSLTFIVISCLTGLIVARDTADLRSATQYGYRNGYVDGFQHGHEDQQAREGYDFHSRDYDNAMRGFESYTGIRDGYRKGYRKGYVAGYEWGYGSLHSHWNG